MRPDFCFASDGLRQTSCRQGIPQLRQGLWLTESWGRPYSCDSYRLSRPMESAILPPENLDRLVKLLSYPGSEQLRDRHLYAIQGLCKQNSNGFAVRDLSKVQTVLEVTIKLLGNGCIEYATPLCDIIK